MYYTYLANMLINAPVMVLRGFLWLVDRVVGVERCDLSAWPFIWPFM